MQFRCGFGAVLAQFWVGGTAPFFFGKNMVFIQTCSFGKWIIFSKTWLFHTHDDFYFGLMDFLSKFFQNSNLFNITRLHHCTLHHICTTAPYIYALKTKPTHLDVRDQSFYKCTVICIWYVGCSQPSKYQSWQHKLLLANANKLLLAKVQLTTSKYTSCKGKSPHK